MQLVFISFFVSFFIMDSPYLFGLAGRLRTVVLANQQFKGTLSYDHTGITIPVEAKWIPLLGNVRFFLGRGGGAGEFWYFFPKRVLALVLFIGYFRFKRLLSKGFLKREQKKCPITEQFLANDQVKCHFYRNPKSRSIVYLNV